MNDMGDAKEFSSCKVTVDAGVCKMKTVITAVRNEETGMVELDIKSDCPNILKMSWFLKPICAYSEVESDFCESDIYKLADEYLPHTACPVPSGMVKAVEVAGGLGLKRDVHMTIE